MIFKFDKSGNMENIGMEGDIDMARKSKDKDRFAQMDMNVVNAVKEEVLGMVNEAVSQTAVGYQEAMDENDEDMVQQHEMELVKEMESESDKIWDKGSRDGVVGDSVDDDESDKSVMSDEELKQKMRERNMGSASGSGGMPIFGSLSNKVKIEDTGGDGSDKEQMKVEEFNKEDEEVKNEKDELKRKREASKLKRETTKNQIIPENTIENWQLEQVLPVMINNSVGKYMCTMSVGLLATLANDNVIHYNENSQRGKKKRAKGYVPYLMVSKVKKIYNQLNSGELNGMLITLNSRIIKNENGEVLNPLIYQSDEMILEGSGQLDAIDGWHRISACRLMLKKWNIKKNQKTMSNPWEYNFIVAIEHKEEIGGGLIFVEYGSTQLKIQTSKLKFLDIYDYANMIVRKLMTNILRDKVEVDKTRTTGTNNIVTFGTLSDAIKRNFKLTTEDDVELISEFLSKFFSKLINLFPNYMGNVSKEDRDLMRTRDLTLELLMFHAYVAISSKLYENQEDWESKLSKLKSIIQVGSWRGHILQSDCPIWDRIFKGGDEKRIVNGSSSVSYVNKVMADYIEFGIDYAVNSIKEDDAKKLEKLNK